MVFLGFPMVSVAFSMVLIAFPAKPQLENKFLKLIENKFLKWDVSPKPSPAKPNQAKSSQTKPF